MSYALFITIDSMFQENLVFLFLRKGHFQDK
jgi:hypothetical protein